MSWRIDKSSSLGMPTYPKKYPRSTSIKAWGCPWGTPYLLAKIRSPFKTLYFYCFMHYAFSLTSVVFTFNFYFCFVCCNKWFDHIIWFGGDELRFFIAKNTPFFTLNIQWVFSFSATAFSFHFLLWFLFRSYFIFVLRCILTYGPCWFLSKELY
jgi:hypothetical protein